MAQATRNRAQQDRGVYEARLGYALAASAYESWHWFEFWRRNEVPIIRRWLDAIRPGTILDAGSGTGLYRTILEGAGHRVIGADISEAMLAVQRQKFPSAPLVQANIGQLPFRAASFDNVLCTRVLSHIPPLRVAFSEFARVAKLGAGVFLADVHPQHRYNEMSIPIDGGRISIETHKHPIADVRTAIEGAGFRIVEFREYRLGELAWKPPVKGFENIYDEPERPIFYASFLRHP